jgi:hypothetical protein
MRKPRYASLQDYMMRRGINQVTLLKIVKAQTGRHISPSLFSMILKGSRRCSRVNAYALHVVTEVPMDELTRWPRSAEVAKLVNTSQDNHVER